MLASASPLFLAGLLAATCAFTCILAMAASLHQSWSNREALKRRSSFLSPWLEREVEVPAEARAPALVRGVARLGSAALRLSVMRNLAVRLTRSAAVQSVSVRLERAGLRDEIDVESLIFGQWLVAGGLVLLYFASMAQGSLFDLFAAGCLAVLAYQTPRSALDRAARARQARIRVALPAAIDILSVSVAGGATLDTAIDLYCQRFSGPLADEFRVARQEVALGRSRRTALQSMADRCDLEPLRNLIAAILQGERFGTPIGHTLRTQSREIKTQRRQWVQEQLARAPVKMVVPLAGFVLPALLIVLLGPAALQFLLPS